MTQARLTGSQVWHSGGESSGVRLALGQDRGGGAMVGSSNQNLVWAEIRNSPSAKIHK